MYSILDDIISKEHLAEWLQFVRTKSQRVIENEELARDFWAAYGSQIEASIGLRCTGDSHVTVSCSSTALNRHTDIAYPGITHKILIYLNDVPNGGTFFWTTDTPILVANKVGRMVIFDIGLAHAGQVFPKGHQKCTIGFRMKAA